MSRKFVAMLSAVMLILSWFTFGLFGSAASADTPGFVVIPYTSCDTAHGTWTAYWQFMNNKQEPGTLTGTGSMDVTYDPAGFGDNYRIAKATASLSQASQTLRGNTTGTMTWLMDNTTQQVTVPTVIVRPDCNHPGATVAARSTCSTNGNWIASFTLTNHKRVAGTLSQTLSPLDRTYGPAGTPTSSYTFTETLTHAYIGISPDYANATFEMPIVFSWEDGTGLLMTFPSAGRPTCVHAKAAVFRDRRGTKHDVYVIPAMKGVAYTIHGRTVRAGTHHAKGIVTVKAIPARGYGLLGTTTWSHRFSTH